jgi:hypothetical protein
VQIGGEILSTHVYHSGVKRMHGLLLGLILFRLVIPPLQSGVVGLCPVRDVWFPNHLPLEGTNHVQYGVYGSSGVLITWRG